MDANSNIHNGTKGKVVPVLKHHTTPHTRL